MTEALNAIVSDLAAPGRFLAFCDETDITNAPTSTMLGDIHLHAAVVLPSEGYAEFTAELSAALETFAVAEFHAVDIVNNGRKSAWRHREKADRLAALQTICDALCASKGHIYFVHIAKEQHEELRAQWPEADLDPDHKVAVKTRFRELIAGILHTETPAIVIADKEKNTPGLGLATVDGGGHLLGGGIILAHSHQVLGLQLADAAAYVTGRYIRRRDGMEAIVEEEGEDAIEAFDRVIAETLIGLTGRFHSLLSQPALHCAAA
jgi:hypothetical protein